MESQRRLLAVKNFILDLVFPRECLGCGEEGKYLCHNCLKKIEINQQLYCVFCGEKNIDIKPCPCCHEQTALQAVFVICNYNDKIVQDLLHNLKYNYVWEIAQSVGILIAEYFRSQDLLAKFKLDNQNTIINAVPLHPKRYLSRGFNQSDLIANELVKNFGFEKRNLLARKINTVSQISLSRSARQQNVKDVFILKDNNFLPNKKVILVDDVLTTGSTLNECTKVLSQAGFTDIYALVIAHRRD
jgi:ComF family protein